MMPTRYWRKVKNKHIDKEILEDRRRLVSEARSKSNKIPLRVDIVFHLPTKREIEELTDFFCERQDLTKMLNLSEERCGCWFGDTYVYND